MQGLPGSSGAEHVLVRYQEAVLHKDWHLAWTVAPIVQAQHAPPSWTWVQLKLKSPPPLPKVCTCCLTGTQLLCCLSTALRTPAQGLSLTQDSLSPEGPVCCTCCLQTFHMAAPDQRTR